MTDHFTTAWTIALPVIHDVTGCIVLDEDAARVSLKQAGVDEPYTYTALGVLRERISNLRRNSPWALRQLAIGA